MNLTPAAFIRKQTIVIFVFSLLLIPNLLMTASGTTLLALNALPSESGNGNSSDYSEAGIKNTSPTSSEEDVNGVLYRTLTLKDAEHLALLNDATVLSAEQDKIVAAERVKEATYLFLPEIGVQASASQYNALYPFALPTAGNAVLFPQSNSQYGSNSNSLIFGGGYMNLNLYEGGRGVNTLKLAQAAQKQAESNYESARMNVILSVKKLFYTLLLAQKKASVDYEYYSSVKKISLGTNLSPWDQIEAESQVAKAEAQYAKSSHVLEMEKIKFLKGLNLELDTPFKIVGELETTPITMDVEKIILWALELRPELQSETYKAQMDAISVNLAQARRTPTVFLSGDYDILSTQNSPINKNNWDATLGLKLPFAYDYLSELDKKRAEQRQGDIKRSELQDQVRLEVRQAYSDIVYWQKEYPLLQNQYLRIEKLYEKAAAPPGNIVLKIHALTAIAHLKISYLEAVTQHLLAKATLERAVGREISQ